MSDFDDDLYGTGSAKQTPSSPLDNGGSDEGEVFDQPPTPVGVRNGYIKNIRTPGGKVNKFILTIQCDEPPYRDSEPLDVWLDHGKMRTVAKLFGIDSTTLPGSRYKFNEPISKLKDRTGKFCFGSYVTKDGEERPSLMLGYPKEPGKSPLWDAADRTRDGQEDDPASFRYTDDQKAAIGRSVAGIIKPDDHRLF